MLLVTSSCSLFRDPTVEDLIADLPKYDDSEEIKWGSLARGFFEGTDWENVRTVGDLKNKLKETKVDPWKNISPEIPIILMKESIDSHRLFIEETIRDKLVMLDVLLSYGADPQRMVDTLTITDERIYAVYIKHGLDAKKPIMYDGYLQYPLTHRDDFITAPIAEWLLKNGADPNQKELESQWSFDDFPLTPLKMLTNKQRRCLPTPIPRNESARTPEAIQKTREVLLKYGAKE